ncbi:hypothetical protein [Methanobacterium spitsbergense]|uniref:Uncharacterized protein n=1 Tax=Methanobacterium spitsbergense TaxID=2874285 RepID=A0A8T5V5B5_9EURY|nr:hypothetical protein [Methanobacterium spitsbergense]MBZ2166855.1 hypothetical protein [Methanobacterium spitsbergense]
MIFRKSTENELNSKEILNQVNRCKPEELENLLNQIETKIEESQYEDRDLLFAKTMTTSRLASMRSNDQAFI